MHWTAFLAYRRFPAHARVADDLPCASCGYNLRSVLANGQCPECGKAVGDSLFVLAKPQVVGPALRTIGKTYLSFLGLLLGCLPGTSGWPMIVGFGIVAFGGFIRTIAIGELRFRGALAWLPIVGARLRWLWWISLLDVILTWLMCGLSYFIVRSMFVARTASAAWDSLVVGWLIVHLFGVFWSGWFGTSLATMLWYTWARWEFIAQRVILLIAVNTIILTILLRASSGNQLLIVLFGFVSVALLGAAMVSTAAGLTHLGNGAEGERDTWDDLVDTTPTGQYSQPADVRKPDAPPIKME